MRPLFLLAKNTPGARGLALAEAPAAGAPA